MIHSRYRHFLYYCPLSILFNAQMPNALLSALSIVFKYVSEFMVKQRDTSVCATQLWTEYCVIRSRGTAEYVSRKFTRDLCSVLHRFYGAIKRRDVACTSSLAEHTELQCSATSAREEFSWRQHASPLAKKKKKKHATAGFGSTKRHPELCFSLYGP